jgi:hypothetical protein
MSQKASMPNRLRARVNYEGKVPEGWRKSSISPYFTQKHALTLKPFLDELHSDVTKKVTFDAKKLRMTVLSCYMRIYQGWLWLIEHADADGKYKLLKDITRIQKGKTTVSIVHGRHNTFKGLEGEVTSDNKPAVDWRTQLVDYVELEGDEHAPLEVGGIPFVEEDMDWIAGFLAPMREQVALIKMTATSFKVCKSKKLVELIKERKKLV